MTLRQSTWNYSNTYDVCQSCFNFFRNKMRYMESVKDIFSALSEETLLKDDPEGPYECYNVQKNLRGMWHGREVTCEPDGRVIFHFNNTTEAEAFLHTLEAKEIRKLDVSKL